MKKDVLVDATISCTPPHSVGRWCATMERKARALEEWARKFEKFIRDHRSQDPISLTVEKQYQAQCSHCHNEWEEDADGPLCCNKAQEEWNLEKQRAA